jgi:hypothetical protein
MSAPTDIAIVFGNGLSSALHDRHTPCSPGGCARHGRKGRRGRVATVHSGECGRSDAYFTTDAVQDAVLTGVMRLST